MAAPKEHHRNYPFRYPLPPVRDTGNDWPFYQRLLRTYVYPQKWYLLLAVLFISFNANVPFVLNFLTKTIVDDILVIRTVPQKQDSGNQLHRTIRAERITRERPVRPPVSMIRTMDRMPLPVHRPADAGRRLLIIGILYGLLVITVNMTIRLSIRRQILIAQDIIQVMRDNLHQKVMELSISYHQAMSPGRLLSRIISDIDTVRVEMITLFRSGVHCIAVLLTGSLVLLFQDWRFAVIVMVCAPIFTRLYKNRRPRIRRLNQEFRHTTSCLYGLTSQKLDGIKAIQSYAREQGELLNFHRLIACNMRDALTTQKISSTLNMQAYTLTSLAGVLVFIYGGWLVLKGEISLGKLLLIHATSQSLFQPALDFSQLPFVLQRLRIALLRVTSVLESKVEIKDNPNAVDFPIPLQKGVTIQNLYFSYPAATNNKEPEVASMAPKRLTDPVLKGINVFVPKGEWLCIMGPSGTGKTTLLALLSRLYEPTFGKILIDDIDLKDIRLKSLRQAVGLVPQEAQIFSGSMRDNICYGRPDATNHQIMEAAKAAQMHDFIMEMKVQYETLIGQKGVSLSGGQRQRLSLARALLTTPQLLLLDDCTSALDAATERKIQETLTDVLQGKTAIMVSQRVSMALRCHKIAVLSGGVITEYGTHQELLKLGGFYATLFREQTT